jgi:hypothetical protein
VRENTQALTLWKFTIAQWIILVGGVLAVVGSLLPWYSVTFAFLGQQQSIIIGGWDVPTGKVTLVLGAASLAFFILQYFKVRLPDDLVSREPWVFAVLGAEAFVVALLYLLDGPRVLSSGGFYSSGAAIGLYLVLIGAAAVGIGGYLRRRDKKSWLL